MRLGIVYHMPISSDASGGLWEIEGSFARYVDSLAPYFDEISLCVPSVPLLPGGFPSGTRIRASNVRIAPLPFFDGPSQFLRRLPGLAWRIAKWVSEVDVLHCRLPTPAASVAYTAARLLGKPIFVLVVGDLRALRPTMPYRGLKKWLWAAYTELEEWSIRRMTRRALTFANGSALARKHQSARSPVVETLTTTIRESEVASRADTCDQATIRLLAVSRIDPRKGLRALPEAVAQLRAAGRDVTLDIIGPVVGRTGAEERQAILDEASRLGVGAYVHMVGSVPLDDLLPRYREYDIFVLPTLPGEGVPRVLLESMAAGMPVITSCVGGIPGLIAHERNGLLIDNPAPDRVAQAIVRVIDDAPLRQRLILEGYATARAHTLDVQAARMMGVVSPWLGAATRSHAAAIS